MDLHWAAHGTDSQVRSRTAWARGSAGRVVRLAMAVGIVGLALTATASVFATSRAFAVSPGSCGSVLLSGSSWLGGSGVSIMSNGSDERTGASCGGTTAAYSDLVEFLVRRTALALGIAAFTVIGTCTCAYSASGTWAPVPSPNAAGSDFLMGVSCASENFCFAVGSSRVAHHSERNLAERWNGRAWRVIPTPDVGSDGNDLQAVGCTSQSRCWAVGTTGSGILILRWNGSKWTTLVGTTGGASGDYLAAVSCGASSMCVAVGKKNGTGLIMKWTGGSWLTVPSAQGASAPYLASVSCASRTFCLAGGQTTKFRAFAEVWRGKNWAAESPPPALGGSSAITSISCPFVSSCTSVGSFGPAGSFAATLVGSRWQLGKVPSSVMRGTGELTGISCLRVRNCTAAGYSLTPAAGLVALVADWNGQRWTRAASLNLPQSALAGIWRDPITGFAVAVGIFGSGPQRTLIESIR